MFVSTCYGGRATDKFICEDSGFYKSLEYGDDIMTDMGFQIQDLLCHYCTLSAPPGARVKSRMTRSKCKEIANLRSHVERAINMKNTFLLTVLPLAKTLKPHFLVLLLMYCFKELLPLKRIICSSIA